MYLVRKSSGSKRFPLNRFWWTELLLLFSGQCVWRRRRLWAQGRRSTVPVAITRQWINFLSRSKHWCDRTSRYMKATLYLLYTDFLSLFLLTVLISKPMNIKRKNTIWRDLWSVFITEDGFNLLTWLSSSEVIEWTRCFFFLFVCLFGFLPPPRSWLILGEKET